MSESERGQESDLLGPVDFLVVEFPEGIPTRGGFDELLDLAERNVIQVLDLEFLVKDDAGVRVVEAADLPAVEGMDLAVWDGASAGLLDAEDLAAVGAEMAPGSLAVVVVFENLWVLGLVDRWTGSGARLILDGAVPVGALLDALDAVDPE